MNYEERKKFQQIVEGFERSYQKTSEADHMPQGPIIRVAFYQACLRILVEGPLLKYPNVQVALVVHYKKLLREEMAKLPREYFA